MVDKAVSGICLDLFFNLEETSGLSCLNGRYFVIQYSDSFYGNMSLLSTAVCVQVSKTVQLRVIRHLKI